MPKSSTKQDPTKRNSKCKVNSMRLPVAIELYAQIFCINQKLAEARKWCFEWVRGKVPNKVSQKKPQEDQKIHLIKKLALEFFKKLSASK